MIVRQITPMRKHLASLDGIRGVAILLVLAHHLMATNDAAQGRLMQALIHVRDGLWVGVDLFFALSGFLITSILFTSIEKPGYFKNFYMRRVLRIFPLYYAVVIVMLIIFASSGMSVLRPLFLIAGYLQNTSLWWNLPSPKPITVQLLGHFWSLAVEEQFYLVWPLVIFLLRDRAKLIWFGCVVVGASLASRFWVLYDGQPLEAAYKLGFCRADSLVMGGMLALALGGPLKARVEKVAPWSLAVGVLGCVAIAIKTKNFNWQVNYWVDTIGFTFLGISACSFMALILREGSGIGKAMESKFLGFFGKYSYGMYVYHQLLNITLGSLILFKLQGIFGSKVLARIGSGTVLLLLTTLVSLASFHLLEQKFLHLKDRFASKA